MSVSDTILPSDILFKILVVACPTLGFFVFALTAIPLNGAVAIITGLKNLFHAVCVPLVFCVVYFLSIHPRACTDVV